MRVCKKICLDNTVNKIAQPQKNAAARLLLVYFFTVLRGLTEN